MLAMQRAVAGLHIAPEYVPIDGNQASGAACAVNGHVVKGDSRAVEISAASILAKKSPAMQKWRRWISFFLSMAFAQHKRLSNRFSSGKVGPVWRDGRTTDAVCAC